MKRTTTLLITFTACTFCYAADKKEERLANKLMKSLRQMEHAEDEFQAYCKSIDKIGRLKPNGVLGCIAVPTPPVAPQPIPTPVQPKPEPKPEK